MGSLANRLHLAAAAAVLVALSAVSGSLAAETVLVPFGSTGVRYATFEAEGSDVVAAHPEILTRSFDDSSWAEGTAPFGSSGDFWDHHGGYCSPDVATPWADPDLTIVARVWFDLPAGFSDVVVSRRHCSSTGLFVNGQGWGSCQGCFDCPWCSCTQSPYDSWFVEGANLIVLTYGAKFANWYHYMDFQVTADIPVSPVVEKTWGTIKSMYPPGH